MHDTDEFFDSVEGLFDFDDDGEYQTDDVDTEEEATEDSSDDAEEENAATEAEENAEDEDSSNEESDDDAEKEGTEVKEEADDGDTKRLFDNLKVNGELRSCTYEEAPAWIQKGMDYDRVKGQLETERQTNQSLQAEVDKNRPYIEMLENAAAISNMSVEALVESVQVGLRMSREEISEKEARATIRAEMAEKKVEALTKKQEEPKAAEPEADNRAEREIAEFARNFPGVQLTDEQIAEMRPDVQNGMSMSSAYLKMENKRLQSEIEAQKRQHEADAKNKKNRAKSSGSQKDSGGGKMDDLADIFEKELFK